MKKCVPVICALVFVFLPLTASAKKTQKIWDEFVKNYQKAEWHYGLERAYEAPNPAKLKGYVVLVKGGLPAERAAFYISWGDYDYRGVTIDGEKVTTRRGAPYTYLQKGDVLAIADTDRIGRTLYLELITADVYVPENRKGDKHHSRVTLQVCYKLPKDVYESDDPQRAMELLGEWLKPFASVDDAKNFAAQMAK